MLMLSHTDRESIKQPSQSRPLKGRFFGPISLSARLKNSAARHTRGCGVCGTDLMDFFRVASLEKAEKSALGKVAAARELEEADMTLMHQKIRGFAWGFVALRRCIRVICHSGF
jgi:hypothetical protein